MNVRSYVNACNCLILDIIYEICAIIFSAKNFKVIETGLTRSAVSLSFFTVVHVVGNLHLFKGPDDSTSTGTVISMFFCTVRALEHRRGMCAVVCVTAHLRGFEEDLGSEVVFWIDERSIEFGHHWLDAPHVHDHSPLPIPASTMSTSCRRSPISALLVSRTAGMSGVLGWANSFP